MKNIFKKYFLLCTICMIFCLAVSTLFLKSQKAVFLSVFSFFVPAILIHFIEEYKKQKRIKQIEEQIADVLLISSSFPKGSFLGICAFIAKNSHKPISEEFLLSEKQINSGMSVEEAIEKIKQRNNSQSLSRALDLIIVAIKSGADMRETFREAAQDSIETNSLLMERNASLTIQKYTLLAGILLVPLILGIISGINSGFDSSFAQELGLGISEEEKNNIKQAAQDGSLIYIFEYNLIACFFVALIERTPKKSVLYCAFTIPISFIIYFVSQGF